MGTDIEDGDISILYVDDEPGLLDLCQVFLERTPGIEVRTSKCAKEALDIMVDDEFDVVISDYQMQDMDGIGLLKALRSRGDQTPFIIFTGKGREDVVIEALNNGADFYLQKGGDCKSQFAELLNMVKHAAHNIRSRKAMTSSKALLEATIDSIPDMIGILDTECRVICYNRAGYEFLGKPPSETIGLKCHEAEDKTYFCDRCEIEAARNSRRPVPFCRHYDDTDTYLEGTVSPVINEELEIEYLVEIVRDITDKRRTERMVRENEDRYRRVVDNCRQGIAVIGNSHFKFMNNRCAELMGYTVEELMTTPFLEFVHPEDREMVAERNFRRLTGEFVPSRYSFRALNGNGSTRWIEISSSIIDWMDGNACLVFLSDITDSMRMERLWDHMISVVVQLLRGDELRPILESITRISERNDSDTRSSILLMDDDRNVLRLGAAPNMPAGYAGIIGDGIPVGPDSGSCGSSVYLRKRVVIGDIRNDPLCREVNGLVELTERNGIRSCCSQPIISSDGRILGTIMNFNRRTGTPDVGSLRLLEQTAKISALAIEFSGRSPFLTHGEQDNDY